MMGEDPGARPRKASPKASWPFLKASKTTNLTAGTTKAVTVIILYVHGAQGLFDRGRETDLSQRDSIAPFRGCAGMVMLRTKSIS